VREVLIATFEEAYSHGRLWPDAAAYPPNMKQDLIYTRPSVPTYLGEYEFLVRAIVVLRERFELHPDGVWVGFGDGHLEFAPTPAALAECTSQAQLAGRELRMPGKRFTGDSDDNPASQPTAPKGSLKVKLVDEHGDAVAGAQVGIFGQWGDSRPQPWHTFFVGKRDVDRAPLVSNATGDVVVPATRVFVPPFRSSDELTATLYILHEARGLVALERIDGSDFSDDASASKVNEIRLNPACKVSGDVTCVGAPPGVRGGGRMTWTSASVSPLGEFLLRSVTSRSKGSHFEMLLPPGEFNLALRAHDSDPTGRFLRIEPGQRELSLHVDLPPFTLVTLVGKPAPELQKIKGWKNGGPVKLADLRGKVVVLDFWGFWCGPCVSSMPALMKLHDEFKDRGLVIIAVHDDSAASIAEMDERLTSARRDLWAGRDLPFLVALDGGGQTRIRGGSMTASGATTAAYGITAFPTALLIDADGKLIKELQPRQPTAREDIVSALDSMNQRSGR
jgi:thiol-disulfide isomerase/thioredoxin